MPFALSQYAEYFAESTRQSSLETLHLDFHEHFVIICRWDLPREKIPKQFYIPENVIHYNYCFNFFCQLSNVFNAHLSVFMLLCSLTLGSLTRGTYLDLIPLHRGGDLAWQVGEHLWTSSTFIEREKLFDLFYTENARKCRKSKLQALCNSLWI